MTRAVTLTEHTARRVIDATRRVEAMPLDRTPLRRRSTAVMPIGISAIHVTGYGDGNRTYTGRRIRADSAGTLIDPQGFRWSEIDEEDIDFDIARGTPSGEVDVRYYWPRLLSQNVDEWWGWAMPVTLATADETIQRWYIVPPFGPWCEAEAAPGTVPDLPSEVPSIPGEPIPPVSFAPVPPGGVPGTEPPPDELILRQRGGRPCGGCGDD